MAQPTTPGEWTGPIERWTTPFTEAQVQALAATSPITGDRVPCVRVHNEESSGWLHCTVPADPEILTDAADPGTVFAVQFGFMTQDEIESLAEFDGW